MNNVTYKAHGVIFLIPATGAWLFGMMMAMSDSLLWGSLNLSLIVVSFAAVIFFYCAKCSARKVCSHILPGYLTRYFPGRENEPYSTTDTVIDVYCVLKKHATNWHWLLTSAACSGGPWLRINLT